MLRLLLSVVLLLEIASGLKLDVAAKPRYTAVPPLTKLNTDTTTRSVSWGLKPLVAAARPFLTTAALSFSLLSNALPAEAASSNVIGSISGSGLVFKDTLQIESFKDPKIPGVSLYISNFQKPLTERISSGLDFFTDPSYASVGCAKTVKGKISVDATVNKTPSGEEVFEESKSLLFKTLRVQRVYDEETNTVVYVSFNTRLDKNTDNNKSRFKSSLCAVNLND